MQLYQSQEVLCEGVFSVSVIVICRCFHLANATVSVSGSGV
jgi:hypothetical protein